MSISVEKVYGDLSVIKDEAEYKLTLSTKIPTAEEYNDLHESVEWGRFNTDAVNAGLSGSLLILSVYSNDGRLIGIGKVIGDGALSFFIHELIVHPEFQGLGIGRKIMDAVMEYISQHATQGAYVALMSAKPMVEFYKSFGFWTRPTSQMGPGMLQFWNNPELNEMLGS